MQTAVHLRNRAPNAVLAKGTPYKALHGKDAYLGRLRAIGAGRSCMRNPHEGAGAPRLGRTPHRVQYGQQIVSGLNPGGEECTRAQERRVYRDTCYHAPTELGEWLRWGGRRAKVYEGLRAEYTVCIVHVCWV